MLCTASGSSDTKPGVVLELFDLGRAPTFIPDLVAGQAPNTVRVISQIDLAPGEDFAPLRDHFLSRVTGILVVEQAGEYVFRLASDDGSKLWINGRLIVDNDGLHGAEPPADGRATLTAGEHELMIVHLEASGDERLALRWLPPGADSFVPVPTEALRHRGEPPETAEGVKKFIPPLRRGRPGDGAPVAGPHPSFLVLPDADAEKPAQANLELLGLIGQPPSGKTIDLWLPPGARVESARPLDVGVYRNHVLVGVGDAVHRIAPELIDGTPQGAAFRSTDGVSNPNQLIFRENRAFELLWVKARSNGIELRFTKPLDPRVGWDPESYLVEAWPFDLQAGRGPKRDGSSLSVKSASVYDDRETVFLQIENMPVESVLYIRLLPPCLSAEGELPWTTEAWYTLHRIPGDKRGIVRTPPPAPPQNVLTDAEKAAGWRLLFDGKTTSGWRGFKKEKCPEGWKVVHESLARVGGGGDIVTVDQFEHFELELEWRISAGGNSGIFFRVSEDADAVWRTGPEMQILDDSEHRDGLSGKTSAGSNYALHAPLRDVTQPVGLWNHVRLVVNGSHVEHWLNGEKIVEYELWSPEWEKLVAASKFGGMPRYGREKRGHIALQDHGDPVWFRNIRIRELRAE